MTIVLLIFVLLGFMSALFDKKAAHSPDDWKQTHRPKTIVETEDDE